MKVRDMCLVALMTALICIAAPLSIPLAGLVPISLATLTVYLAGALLGAKRGTLAVLLYILIGMVGLPVFSGFTSGVQKLVGVTGGYLIGYLPCVAAVGFAVERWGEHKWVYPVSMVVGTALLYLVGTVWFMYQMNQNLMQALASCVIPFLIGDAAKIVIATVLGVALRKSVLMQK